MKKRKQSKSLPRGRRWIQRALGGGVLLWLALSVGGFFYVRQSNEFLSSHRWSLTAPLEYFGERLAYFTDAMGWTGHDAVYPYDEAPPTNSVFFAGVPTPYAENAPQDIHILRRTQDPFAIGWSRTRQRPVWAAYHLIAHERFPNEARPAFWTDRTVKNSPQPNDYAGTGFDRGHMVPNHALVTRYGTNVQKETFKMTNIAPQRPGLNRGPWRELEQLIGNLWTRAYGDLWVIVGALDGPAGALIPRKANSSKKEKQNPPAIAIPAQFYMIVIAQTKSTTTKPNQEPYDVRALALLFDQSAQPDEFIVHRIVTIQELEHLSGLHFFPDLPGFIKRPLFSDRPTRLWPIRWFDVFRLIATRFPTL